MLVDISDLIGKKKLEKEIEVSLQSEKIVFEDEEIVFEEPVHVKGIFTLSGDIINFKGIASAVLKLTCSRCLEKFSYPLKIEINEQFSKFVHNEDDDIILIENDTVDFKPIIETNIILSLPMKKLCSDECKGLCSVCGTNLNHSTCNCMENDIDPRFAKLRDLFSNN